MKVRHIGHPVLTKGQNQPGASGCIRSLPILDDPLYEAQMAHACLCTPATFCLPSAFSSAIDYFKHFYLNFQICVSITPTDTCTKLVPDLYFLGSVIILEIHL